VTRVDHGNGTVVVRQYDAADRLTLIRHEDAGGNAMLELAYTYSADGLVTRIIETDEVTEAQGIVPPGQAIPPIVSQVDFEYDARNRLTRETRTETGSIAIDTGPVEYDLSYTYDAGGNRLSKTDGLTGRVTTYVYDIETDNAIDNDQHNNRLLGYDVTDTDPATGAAIAVEQTLYKYGPAGNVMLLVKRGDDDGNGVIDPADTMALAWWFYYDTGNHLWLAVQGTGIFDEPTGTLTNTVFDKAAEYRYDSGRQRYLVRERDPNEGFAIVGTGQWRDYMGNNIYNDYTVDQGTGTVTNGIGYIPGIGFDDPALADSPAYLGSDLIGTTRRVVDSSTGGQGGTGVSPVIQRTILTAFGEPLLPSPPEGEGQGEGGTGNTRYGYAGAWGYEEPEGSFDPLTELGWLHVGERYYDPAIGRFMQRDPKGISSGSLNLYAYVLNEPTIAIDPDGLTTITSTDVTVAGGVLWATGIPVVSQTGQGLTICGGLWFLSGRLWGVPQSFTIPDHFTTPSGDPVSMMPPTVCFVADTLVAADNKAVPIEAVSVGNRVVSKDFDRGTTRMAKVMSQHVGETRSLISITLQAETIKCTKEHPFWTKNRGWVKAGALILSDVLENIEGQPVRIVDLDSEELDREVRVYNLEVDGNHNYYVGHTKVLVHNKPMW
jgi:RHS repeat-associated protein